jgi:hypothetical protein
MNTPNNLQAAIEAAKLEQAKAAAAATAETPTTAIVPAKKPGKSYQFPSAPTNFIMPDGRRIVVPDGVHTTEDPDELRELDAMVRAGTIWPAAALMAEEFTPQMQAPEPLDPNKVN